MEKYRGCPLFHPNGWIPVAESKELSINKIIQKKICGQEIIIFRGSNNKVHTLNAYCPHIGANLGIGGQVVQSCNKDYKMSFSWLDI